MTPLKIHYVIPLLDRSEDLENQSLLQGFTEGILTKVHFFRKIMLLPQNILHLYAERDRVISQRISGRSFYTIIPLMMKYLGELPISPDLPFFVFFSDEQTYEDVDAFLTQFNHPILHVSSLETANTTSLQKVSDDDFQYFIEEVIAYLEKSKPSMTLDLLKDLRGREKPWDEKVISSIERSHLCTVPNELTLLSLKYRFRDKEVLAGFYNDPYVDAIGESADNIIRERERIYDSDVPLLSPPSVSLVITAASVFRHHYTSLPNFNLVENAKDRAAGRAVFKMLRRQKDYAHKIEPQIFSGILESDFAKVLMQVRMDELRAYTVGVSLTACNNFAPTLRLPPVVNTIQPDLKRLGGCARGNSPHRIYKMNKIGRKIRNKLSDMISSEFMSRIDVEFNKVKLICDAPLEWVPIRDLPLMLRYDTSRIPTTPGNLFFQQAISGNETLLPVSAFEEILVIRSYDEFDPIRNLVITAINEFLKIPSKLSIKVRVVDVSNTEELIMALNGFDGAVMIYDGHGWHGNDPDIGGLKIGKELVNVWDLVGQVRIPPIVLLSACDTHPVDASHASTANGFLRLGAQTVLGTMLPVDARYSAMFIGRLIYRIAEFVPIVTQNWNLLIRWTHVVSGLLRMMFVTELTLALVERGKYSIPDEICKKIGRMANELINSRDTEWYEKTLKIICMEANLQMQDLEAVISKWVQITDVMKYTQLGNPEKILILSKDYENSLNMPPKFSV